MVKKEIRRRVLARLAELGILEMPPPVETTVATSDNDVRNLDVTSPVRTTAEHASPEA